MDNGSQYGNSSYGNSSSYRSSTTNLTDAVVDTMVRWPMRMTGATMDLMWRGMQSMTGSGGNTRVSSSTSDYSSSNSSARGSSNNSANSGWSTVFSNQTSGTFDQDLSGDDLKYVIWSIVFTKPGYECVLEKQHEEIVNYSADGNAFAAVKIAKFLDKARHGHAERPEAWSDRGYPTEAGKGKQARSESTTVITTPSSTSVSATSSPGSDRNAGGDRSDKGWRIPNEDHKYIHFLYRVDRRLPKEEEVTRVERVTVERGTRVV